MLEGLWRINPNLIENIAYYVSVMPTQYRKELLRDVYINTPMDSKINYNTWKEINFDEDYTIYHKQSQYFLKLHHLGPPRTLQRLLRPPKSIS